MHYTLDKLSIALVVYQIVQLAQGLDIIECNNQNKLPNLWL